RHRSVRDEGDGRHERDGGPDREGSGGPVLMASGMTVAVVGATGAAGQATLRILEERKFPVRELRVFASERSVGKTVPFRGDAGRLRRVIAVSYQAVSGAGVNGIAELREQTLAWARGETIQPRHFPHPIAFNLIPAIDRFGPDGYTAEEMKLVNETRKILELPGLLLSPTTVRVPVCSCHSTRA